MSAAEPEAPARRAYGPVRSFRDLDVYQRSLALVKPVYEAVKSFPDYERQDLVLQMRRACKPVPANIAEGFGRHITPRDYRLFLSHALGSANEMQVHLQTAKDRGYLNAVAADHLFAEYDIIARQLNRLISRWK